MKPSERLFDTFSKKVNELTDAFDGVGIENLSFFSFAASMAEKAEKEELYNILDEMDKNIKSNLK